jgi:hypothetical protein
VPLVEPASAGVAVDDGEECTAVVVGDLDFVVVEPWLANIASLPEVDVHHMTGRG